MDSTHTLGLLLIGLSGCLLATHWQQWRDSQQRRHAEPKWCDYFLRTTRRRAVASSLVGVVGFTLLAFETVPRTPLSITAYLLSLVVMTSWILWLALVDLWAARSFHTEQQLDKIAKKLREAEREPTPAESPKTANR